MPDRQTYARAIDVAPAFLYAAFIFFMSALSAPPTPKFGLDWGDKLTHAGAFALMFWLVLRAVLALRPTASFGRHLAVALAFTILYGASDEVHQAFVPNRECDLLDWIADSVGALVAAGVLAALRNTSPGRLLLRAAGAAQSIAERTSAAP